MYKVIERRMIVPNLHEFTVHAPAAAASVKPSNSVVLRAQRPRSVLIA
jgi:NAD(P)H-flavin reductase